MKRVYQHFTILLLILALFLPSAYSRSDLPEGAKMRLGKDEIKGLQFSPDGTQLAVASWMGIQLYRVSTGEEIDLLIGHSSGVYTVCFSPDGEAIAGGSGDFYSDNAIRLWDAIRREHLNTLMGHKGSINFISFSPDGRTLASASHDDTVWLWDIATADHLKRLKWHMGDCHQCILFHPMVKPS